MQSLSETLQETNYFNSIYESKILTLLVTNPNMTSVKDICDELGLPDSKVYPSLKKLEKLHLVLRDKTQRPNRFYFTNPQNLYTYLESKYEEELTHKKELVDLIKDKIDDLWNPDKLSFDQVAYIFKGKSIKNEILRIQKITEEKIMYLLSPKFSPYVEDLLKFIPKLLENDVRVEIAIPPVGEMQEQFKQIINSNHPKLKIKFSYQQSNSYIVRDQNTMLNILHREVGNVALLTNDPLLVEYIDSCWENEVCCGVSKIYDQGIIVDNSSNCKIIENPADCNCDNILIDKRE